MSDSQTRNSAIQQIEQFVIKWFQFLLADTANGPKSVKWLNLIKDMAIQKEQLVPFFDIYICF